MKTFFSIALFFISIGMYSQSFSWGYPFQIPDETEKTVTHVVDDNLYRISSHYDLGTFNYNIIVDQFSLNELEKTGSLDLSVQQPAMGVASRTFHSMFQQNGTDFTFFYTEYDRQTKENILFSRKVNIGSGQMGELVPITTIPDRDGNFILTQSPNKQYIAVLKELPFDRKANEKIALLLLNNGKVVQEKAFEYAIEDDRDKTQTLFVSNKGQVFIVKKIDERREKPYLAIFYWNKKSNDLSKTTLKQPDNFQIYQFAGKFDQDNFYLFGALTHEKSTTFGLKIDLNGRNSGIAGSGLLVVKMAHTGELEYAHRNDFEGVVSNLNLDKILFDDSHIWAVFDRSFVKKESKSTNIAQDGFSYDYTYLNNGFVVSYIDKSTGTANWTKTIDTFEPNTKNDNGDYLSTLSYLDNSNLVLLYNETRDLNTGIIHNVFNRRFPIKEVISPSGETLSRKALLSAGIGVTKEEKFELGTHFIIPISENRFIIRASNRVEYKYGYMKSN